MIFSDSELAETTPDRNVGREWRGTTARWARELGPALFPGGSMKLAASGAFFCLFAQLNLSSQQTFTGTTRQPQPVHTCCSCVHPPTPA
jgi:hypothetical protein